jgi:S-adenosylmethionine decarboxylase
MPGTDAASRHPELRRQQELTPKALHAVDAALTSASPVAGIAELTSVAAEAVAAGGGHVLETSHVSFPNGAVTLVLILAESHLSIHTWPEEQLIAIDLFSCGAIDADAVLARLVTALRLEKVQTRYIRRGVT